MRVEVSFINNMWIFSYTLVHPYQFDISALVQNDVLRLEVSVDDTSAVQEDERLDNTRRVKPGGGVVEHLSVT